MEICKRNIICLVIIINIFVVINRAEKQINLREKRFINEIDIDRITKVVFGTPGIPFQGSLFGYIATGRIIGHLVGGK